MTKLVPIDFSEEIIEIVASVAAKYPDLKADKDKAIEAVVKQLKARDDYESIVEMMLRNSIQEMIYDARHTNNVATKRSANYYGPGSTFKAVSDGVKKVYKSIYDVCIAGTTLGEIKGADLGDIEQSELAKAGGHRFNARLCARLREMKIPDEMQVKKFISEKKLRNLYNKVLQETASVA